MPLWAAIKVFSCYQTSPVVAGLIIGGVAGAIIGGSISQATGGDFLSYVAIGAVVGGVGGASIGYAHKKGKI